MRVDVLVQVRLVDEALVTVRTRQQLQRVILWKDKTKRCASVQSGRLVGGVQSGRPVWGVQSGR